MQIHTHHFSLTYQQYIGLQFDPSMINLPPWPGLSQSATQNNASLTLVPTFKFLPWSGSSQSATQNNAGSTPGPALPLSSQLPANSPAASDLPSSDLMGLGWLMSHVFL